MLISNLLKSVCTHKSWYALTKVSMTHLFPSSLKSGLYVITCQRLDKHYVGQSENVTARLNAHKTKLKRGCHESSVLQEDFQKYGENGFLFQKLFFGAGLEKRVREEFETCILLVLSEQSRYNFYTNWRKRGRLTNPFFGKKHTLEARKAQSNAKKGLPSPFAGKKQSDEVRQVLSRHNSGKADRRKPLRIDSHYYESITEASEKTGLSRRLIRERCNSENIPNYCWVEKEKEAS
uniref:Putative GIY-YIG homing endonuclease n=1 Tax=Pleurastrosarcina brevispinosa TaxID=163096 RepID=A0A097KN84_9CHLO|nr:putative GIY-YIG homing endonuclease [Chlorosarcina brevispinosa]